MRTRTGPVAGVILDSGGVLIRPVGGEWFPTQTLEQVLDERGLFWERWRLAEAVAAGSAYLDSVHDVQLRDEAEERSLMARYHAVVLAGVGVTEDGLELGREIQRREELRPVVEPYEWTLDVLSTLQQWGIPVVVLSNAWPSLRRLHRGLDIEHYYQAMVISAEEGVSKPDPRLFRRALAELGLPPEQTVFVDDWPGHVEAAHALGIRGVWLRPSRHEPRPELDTITDLHELLTLIV